MDTNRSVHLLELMRRSGYDALVCRMPQYVLMLTGYPSVLGTTFCLVSLGPGDSLLVRLAVPEQEKDLLPEQAALEVQTFSDGTSTAAAREPLEKLFRSAELPGQPVIGYESGSALIVSDYSQTGVPGTATRDMLGSALPNARWSDASPLLEELAAIKTETELVGIRASVDAAYHGFVAAREAIRPGATEAEVRAATTAALLISGHALRPTAGIVLAHAHVMAGTRSALAYKAFNLTTNAAIQGGDTVVVQLEMGINGYWAELTRTFFAGTVRPTWLRAQEACVRAQESALDVIRAGAIARDADAAARDIVKQAGFGEAFKHGLGHGCGFQSIQHAAQPILDPSSSTTLRAGMVHNLEPAVYLSGHGGLRLNDMVAVHENGCEVLSAQIPRDLSWLTVG